MHFYQYSYKFLQHFTNLISRIQKKFMKFVKIYWREKTLYMILRYLTLIRIISMTHINSKAAPTNDTDYSCYLQVVELV